MSERVYVESTPTNCTVGGEHGQVVAVVRHQQPRPTPRAVFVHLDAGDMLYVTLGKACGDRNQWHEVAEYRRIDRDEFDRLTEIDTLRHDLGWRPPSTGCGQRRIRKTLSGAREDVVRAVASTNLRANPLDWNNPAVELVPGSAAKVADAALGVIAAALGVNGDCAAGGGGDHESQFFDDRWRCLRCGATLGPYDEETPDA